MKAIQDDEINMIGVCGMGGVGKTALVKQVAKQARDDSLFDDIVMAVVSQTPNLTTIQQEIAEMLGLKLVDQNVEGRARRLQARLERTRSALVILDDVWEPIDLEDIGIHFGAQHKGCKIVLTSRSEDALHKMGAKKVILVDLLPEQEAWDLFRKMADDSVDSPHLRPLALKVVKKCAGLPIAITTVANALRGKSLDVWMDAVDRLATANVHSTLQLNFDHLPSEEVRSFFLLCSLLCEDTNIIAIEDVWKYGMGLGLFQGGGDTMEQGRDRAYALADTLIYSSLLQRGIHKDSVKMHDIVRDFAISIAFKDEHGFLVRSDPWTQFQLPDYTRYTTISLTSNQIIELPTHAWECPKLEFLYLQFNHPSLQFIPDNFFSRMKKLKVLVMSGMRLLSLPQSLMDLDLHLQTLCLEWCTLKDISIIGSLQKLKILSLVGSNIEELPRAMGELTRLEMLDLSQCQQLRIIPHHVILRLSQLQVLYMPRHPARSNVGILDNGIRDPEIVNVRLEDLFQLPRLTSLKIRIDDTNSLPEEFIFQNLSRFQISIGLTDYEQPEHFLYSKALTLKSLSTSHLKLLTPCFKTAEYLYLEEIKGLRNVLFDAESAMFEAKTSYNNKGNDVSKKELPTITPLHDQLEELQGELNYIKKALGKLKILEDGRGNSIKEGLHSADGIVREVTEVSRASFQPNLFQNKLHELNGFITELKRMVLLEDKMNFSSAEARPSLSAISDGYNHQNSYDRFPNLHLYHQFHRCLAFKNIQDIYESLQVTTNHCLLCIAAFPENETLKKRFLIYWWIGEGIIRHGSGENTVEDVFKELLEKGLIEPVNKKHKLVVNSFKMNPLIRSVVIMLAQDDGLFDVKANFLSNDRTWLVKSDGRYSLLKLNSPNLDKGKIKTMLNVSESHPSFQLKWFSQMENLNVLYMGRSANNRHIDVEDTAFLEGLSIMNQLKFFSLQGTSGIMKLSDSICRLTNLMILDLRACHNLELLPEGIGSLQNLTHLDMSECYFLVHMPKGLALLVNLQILKGFVIGEHLESKNVCTLNDLIHIRKLRKLSISTGRKNFPTKHELSAFQKLESLRKLTIEWGVRSSTEPMTAVTVKPRIKKALSKLLTLNQDRVTVSLTPELHAEVKELSTTPELPVELEELSTTPELTAALEKFDIRCFPGETTPSWLMPGKLQRLKKLYIIGGKLSTTPEPTERKELSSTPELPVELEELSPTPELPAALEKLDLRCFPGEITPSWLTPGKLPSLKKLYIRGGKLDQFNQVQEENGNKWKVEILRLKYLRQLKMEWNKLHVSFPDLVYLEKV